MHYLTYVFQEYQETIWDRIRSMLSPEDLLTKMKRSFSPSMTDHLVRSGSGTAEVLIQNRLGFNNLICYPFYHKLKLDSCTFYFIVNLALSVYVFTMNKLYQGASIASLI